MQNALDLQARIQKRDAEAKSFQEKAAQYGLGWDRNASLGLGQMSTGNLCAAPQGAMTYSGASLFANRS